MQYPGRKAARHIIKLLVVITSLALLQFASPQQATASSDPTTFSAVGYPIKDGKAFEVAFTASRVLNGKYLFDVELWDKNNKRVFQSYGTTRVTNTNLKTMVRDIPTDLAPGTYTIKAGWFSPSWVTKLLWVENAGQVTVGAPAPQSGVVEQQPVSNDLNGWKYIFGDNFDTDAAEGSFLSKYRNWGAYDTGWPDTSRRGMYDTNIISTKDGLMNIRLHTGADGKPRASVPFPLINGRGAADETNQLYGRYEVKFRADEIPGYKTAFLLWPESEVWPRDGEIDFPEGDLNSTIGGFTHYQNGTWGGDQAAFSTNARYGNWHTAVIEWAPTHVTFILDGKEIGKTTKRIPNTPMHWVLQTETCLDGCKIPRDASGNVQIDHVKVWKYDPSVVVN